MLNSIVLVGRLVRDPEFKRLDSGLELCNFTLAVDKDFKDRNGEKRTIFIDCTAWRHNARYIEQYLKKGMLMDVRGEIDYDEWTDKNSGSKRRKWFVNCEVVHTCEGRREATPEQRQQYTSPGYTAPTTYAPPPAYGGDAYTQGDFAMLDDDDAQLPF